MSGQSSQPVDLPKRCDLSEVLHSSCDVVKQEERQGIQLTTEEFELSFVSVPGHKS